MKRTFSKLETIFKSIETIGDDIKADMDDMFDKTDLGPLPDGVTEEKTVEESTKPDGTKVVKTVVRRVTRSKS